MKIEKSKVQKIKISGIDKLDPISVFLEDFGPRQGKITIQCYNETWSAFWGGMGDRTIAEFFCSCDNGYLSQNLSDIRSMVPDNKALRIKARKTIGKNLADKEITKSEAVELLEDLDLWDGESTGSWEYGLFSRIFRCSDWMFDIPQKTNHRYEYLCRIIDTVKEVLGEGQ